MHKGGSMTDDYFVQINHATLTKIIDDAAQSRAMLEWLEAAWQQRLGSGPAHVAACRVHSGVPLRTALLALMASSEPDVACNPLETVHN